MEKRIADMRARRKYHVTPERQAEFDASPLKQEGDELLYINTYDSEWHVLRAGEIVLVKYEEIGFYKKRDIDHYRKHGKQSVVIESEIEKMKEFGLYKEGDEFLTTDDYNGYFIVLRNGYVEKIKYSEGNKIAELEEAIWWEKAKRGEV
jgi:hypothetical protein